MTKLTEKKVCVSEIELKAAVSKFKSIGEHFDDIMDVAVDESLPNWEREQKKLIRKHYKAECKEKEKFLCDFFASVGIPKKVLKIKVSYDYDNFMGSVDYSIEVTPKTEKIDTDQLEKIVDYFGSRNTTVEVSDFWDSYDCDEVLEKDDAKIEIEIEKATEEDKLTAEVAELKRRGAEVIDAKVKSDGTRCITTKGAKGVFRNDSVQDSNNADLSFIDESNTASWLKNRAEMVEFEKNNAEKATA